MFTELQKWCNGSYHRGTRADHCRKASAGILCSVLLQLEEIKVVEKLPTAGGRRMSREVQQDLE